MYEMEKRLAAPRLGKESDGDIGKSLRVPRNTIASWRVKAGVAAFGTTDPVVEPLRIDSARLVAGIMNAIIDPGFATDPVDVVAARHGLRIDTLAAIRVELGIGSTRPRKERAQDPVVQDIARKRRDVQTAELVVLERTGPVVRKREDRTAVVVTSLPTGGRRLVVGGS